MTPLAPARNLSALVGCAVLVCWAWLFVEDQRGAWALSSIGTWILELAIMDRLGRCLGATNLSRASQITLFRGFLLCPLAGYVVVLPTDTAWVPAILYFAATALDAVDGFVARRTGNVTEFGARLDVQFDALGLLLAPMLAVRLGALPPAYLIVGLLYYGFNAAVHGRRRLGRPVHDDRLRPSPHNRVYAGLQMALVGAALVPGMAASIVHGVAYVFMAPLIIVFGRDWLVIIGALVPNTEPYERRLKAVVAALDSYLPLAARAMLLLSGAFASLPWPLSVLVVCAIVGFGARTASAALLLFCAYLDIEVGVPVVLALATVTTVGSGRLSPWAPEDSFLFRKFGGQERFQWGHATGLLAAISTFGALWLFRDVDWMASARVIQQIGLPALALWGGVTTLVMLLWNLRGYLVSRALGIRITFFQIFGYRLAALAFSLLTPGPLVGGEPLQAALMHRRNGASGAQVTAAVALDRVLELVVNMAFLAALVALSALDVGSGSILTITVILVLAVTWLVAVATGRRPCGRLFRSALVDSAEQAAGDFCREHRGTFGAVMLISIIGWLGTIAEAGVAWTIVGAPLGPREILTALLAHRISLLLPVPAALGTLEASQLLVAHALGIDPSYAIAVCALIRARDVLVVLAGLGCLGASGIQLGARRRLESA